MKPSEKPQFRVTVFLCLYSDYEKRFSEYLEKKLIKYMIIESICR